MRCQGRVGFPPTDPPSLWGDSLCLGLEGGAGSCSPSWALLLRAPGVPHVSGHESHISEVIDVEAVGLFVTRPQVTAEGRISPGVTSGTAQIFDIGQFLMEDRGGWGRERSQVTCRHLGALSPLSCQLLSASWFPPWELPCTQLDSL